MPGFFRKKGLALAAVTALVLVVIFILPHFARTQSSEGSGRLSISSAAAGAYVIQLQGYDPSGNAVNSSTLTVNLTVQDFSLSISPVSQSVEQGASGTYTVSVSGSGGFSSPVLLSASGLPSGATAAFSPASVAPGGQSTLTINIAGPTPPPPNQYTFVVSSTSNGLTRTASASFNVLPPPVSCSSFTATPDKIIYSPPRVGSSTLSWSCTNALTCIIADITNSTTVGTFNGNSGTTVVRPVFTSTYQIVCSKYGGSSTPLQATVTVLSPVIIEQ